MISPLQCVRFSVATIENHTDPYFQQVTFTALDSPTLRLSNKQTRTGVELPRTPSEITPEFLTIAFHSYGTYPATVTVTSMELLKAPRTGLLSDIHRITYKLSDDRPTKPCYVKFAPLDLKTRITTDLFKMGTTEITFYHEIQKVFPMVSPKCIFADIDRTFLPHLLIPLVISLAHESSLAHSRMQAGHLHVERRRSP